MLAGQNQLTLACFEIGGRRQALDVSHLREVLRWQPPTPLPKAPPLIEGVIDVRGAVVPVIDLGRALGGEPVTGGARARIAIAELDGLLVGLAVEAALEVIPVDASALGDPPGLVTQAGYGMVRAVLRRQDAEPVPILALEQVVESIYRSSLATREEVP